MNRTVVTRIIKSALLLIITVSVMAISGCSNRVETPVITNDLTIQHLPKDLNGINAKITFCSYLSKKNNKPVNIGTRFTIGDREKVLAVIDLTNREKYFEKPLLFHISWIGPGGNDIYTKIIDLQINDSTNILRSSISIPPEKRTSGIYSCNIYLFRELIAKKSFELLAPDSGMVLPNYARLIDSLKADILLRNKNDKKTGRLNKTTDKFVIKEKSKVYAEVKISNRDIMITADLIFYLHWIDLNDSTFYKKRIKIPAYDSTSIIKSLISITPGKRVPGNYKLRIFLFDKLISEKNFILKSSLINSSLKKPGLTKERIIAEIILCKYVSKKSGLPIGIDSIFTIKENGKVTALIDLQIDEKKKDDNVEIHAKWISPNNKSFFTKKLKLSFTNSSERIKSTITIPPSKRKPGMYKFQLFYTDILIGEKHFELVEE